MKRAGVFGCCVLVLLSLLWSGAQAEVTGREQAQMIATETHETLPNPGSFDLSTRTVTLNSGYTMPINGPGNLQLARGRVHQRREIRAAMRRAPH